MSITDGSSIITRGQIQCQVIERLLLPGLIVGISLRHHPDVLVIAVTHMDSRLLLNKFKRVEPHCSEILVPLCGGVSASAVFIPLQADPLNQKRVQMLQLMLIMFHHHISFLA